MKFNRFLWNNFKESKTGKHYLRFFAEYHRILEDVNAQNEYEKIIDEISIEVDEASFSIEYFEMLKKFVETTKNYLQEDKISIEIENETIAKEIYDFLYDAQYEKEKEDDEDRYVFSFYDISFISDILYILYPQFFIPYYFERKYHTLVKIFEEFGIFLPSVPARKDKKQRFYHYFEICLSLYNFRKENELAENELPAFIYGFACNVIDKYRVNKNYKNAQKAFFIGGGKKDKNVDSSGDFNALDDATEETIFSWNGNTETQPGDIILMYCLSPRSYIHSIWRAVTPGYIDPFFIITITFTLANQFL